MFASAKSKNVASSKLTTGRGGRVAVNGKNNIMSNGSNRGISSTRRSSAGNSRTTKSPRKNVSSSKPTAKSGNDNVFQHISCTSSVPEVVEPKLQKPLVVRKTIAKKPTTKAVSFPNGVPAKPIKQTPIVEPAAKSPKEAKPQPQATPRASTALLRPCKCPACTRKRASGATDNSPAEGHVPQPLTGTLKVAPSKPSVKINEVRRQSKQKLHLSSAKSPRSQLPTTKNKANDQLNIKENFEDENTWQVVEKGGPASFLRNLFNKPVSKIAQPDENVAKSSAPYEDQQHKMKQVEDVHDTGLDSVSLILPPGTQQIYKRDREGSDGTQCESFNFVQMPLSFDQVDDNDAPFFALKDDNSKKIDIIRSKLGSRNGERAQTVIEWKKGNMLGRGAFGTVWCGLTITGELIAVKQAEISSIDMEKANKEYEKVQQEVELLKSLHHPNIVGYLGTCLEGRIVSIFMQYIPGGSLASLLKKFGSLAEPVISRYTKQILDGVSYLHSKNVVHRDLKGSNIMLFPNGVIKLIDFGCAKKLMNITKSNAEILKSMKGTPYWMAPEVISETGHGKKSDIWSIGCTLYEMATTKPPWADLNRYAALYAISNGTSNIPQLTDKFSQEAKQFVSLCLQREPKDRPDTEKLLGHNFILHYWQPETRIQDSRGIPVNANKKLRN